MISRIADWYRIAQSDPDDPTIEKRKLSIREIVQRIEEAEDLQLICALVSIAVFGANPKHDSQKETIGLIMKLLCEHQPSLPTDPNENGEIVRACAIIALGEIVAVHESAEAPRDLAVLGSSLLQTSIGLRPNGAERLVEKTLAELVAVAQSTLGSASEARRVKQSARSRIEQLATDANTKQLVEATKEVVALLEDQMSIQREELEALWWLRGGYSNILRKPLSAIDICSAALVAALEVADRCLLPPPESACEMVAEAMSHRRAEKDMVPITLQIFLGSIDTVVADHVVVDCDQVKRLVTGFPEIFPLSECLLAGAENVQARKRGVSPVLSKEYSPLAIAKQMFYERISQRLVHERV